MSSQPAEQPATPAASGKGRKPRTLRSMTVADTEWLTPDMVRVHFTGADLAELPELTFTDHYVKLLFPPEGADYSWPFDPEELRETAPREQWPVTRTYTIRSFDRESGRLAIDFVVHGDTGLAGPWAAAAQPGATLGFFGPGGAYAPEADYDTHLLAGDEAAIPAIAAALEQLPAGARAIAFLEVSDADHQQEIPNADRVELVWVHRGTQPYGEPLAQAVRQHGIPEGNVQIFVHGNAQMIKDLRRFLFVENGVDRRQVSISGYWRTGQNEDAWQSGKREFMAGVEAEEAAALSAG